MSAFTQVVPPEVLAEASTDVFRFCEYIQNIPDHESHCGHLCGEIRTLNLMMQQTPLDAFVLLPQIFCISKMADVTDEDGRRHVFEDNKNAIFLYEDQNGKQATKNIMHVIDRMKIVLIELCQSGSNFTKTDCHSTRSLLGKLKSLISTQDL
jgi:hypothetical protein